MERVTAQAAYFIKLGRGGKWEYECLNNGTIQFGYQETPHDACVKGEWEKVAEFCNSRRETRGAATRDTNQIRIFYEADEDAVFVTFHGGLMYWCRARAGVELDNPTRIRTRRTIDGWHSKSVGGQDLRTDRLAGMLLRVQGFRGTICEINQLAYLLGRINDELPPKVAAAAKARADYLVAIGNLVGLLTWQDFELLVDLIFTQSGWRRLGCVGKTQKIVDLELQLPTTGDLAFVQIKSEADNATFQEYLARFESTEKYDRMFFAWHKGVISQRPEDGNVTLLDRERIAEMTLDSGLASWLQDKVS